MRVRTMLLVLATLATAVSLVAPAAAAEPSEVVVVGGPAVVSDRVLEHLQSCAGDGAVRIAGRDRFATAAAVADQFGSADTVFLATGYNFPDAISGGPVAALEGAPLLLVRADGIPTATRDALQRLAPSRIVLLGGTAVIGRAVEDGLRAQYGEVIRLAGPDRYGTAAAISQWRFAGGSAVVYVASGATFLDALVAGPRATLDNAPILLVSKTSIPGATARELARLAPDRVVVIGANGVITDDVVRDLGAFAPTVERLAGSSRYSTAANIAATISPTGRIFVVTVDNFPDGLAAVPLANGTPIVYAALDQIHQVTADAITLHTGMACEPLAPPAPPPKGDAGRSCPSGWVALTYDDGPRPGRTDTVVASLERAGIRGTFFAVGYLAAAYPSTLRNAYNHDHAIANHTWNHENLRELSYSRIVSTVSRTDQQIRSAGIPSTRLVRPPYGATDSRVRRALSEAGFGQALWNIDPRDWAGTSTSGIYNNVVRNARNGSVVVMHDGAANYRSTAAATERIVTTLHARGFCFGVLDANGRIIP